MGEDIPTVQCLRFGFFTPSCPYSPECVDKRPSLKFVRGIPHIAGPQILRLKPWAYSADNVLVAGRAPSFPRTFRPCFPLSRGPASYLLSQGSGFLGQFTRF